MFMGDDGIINFVKSQKLMCIGKIFEKHALNRPNAIALIAPNRKSLTYAELHAQVEAVVSTLNGLGIGWNDRVAVVLPNGSDMATVFTALVAGATCVPLNPEFRDNEFEYLFATLGINAVITQSEANSPARDVAQAKGIPIIELRSTEVAGVFELSGKKTLNLGNGGYTNLDDVALVMHTSGTTAKPKIVPLTQKNLLSSAENHIRTLNLSPDDCCLNMMPLYHMHGLVSVLFSSLVVGASVVCVTKFDCQEFFSWLDEYSPTWYSASPTIHQGVLDCIKSSSNEEKKYSFRFIRSAAAPLPTTVMEALENIFNVPMIEAYGMTEASGQICSNPLPPKKRIPGSVGLAAGTQVAIIDEKGNKLQPGHLGEVIIRGENVLDAYEKAPQANKDNFINGWFRTGDLGEWNADGYLFIRGRIKEIINRGGNKIFPREVDEALMNHPEVAEALTFGIPHRTLGEDVVTAIVPKKEDAVSAKDIRAFAFSVLADFKVPSHVEPVKEIPRSATGKPQYRKLIEKIIASSDKETELPQNYVEQEISAIWIEILGLSDVSLKDNFFMLGGDSLSANIIVNRIRKQFLVDFSLTSIFERPILGDQAALVEKLYREKN
jgi:acyl-CoA synthetase (AMP-forming)/AMP-acid ligase II/acyl carrier protein